MIDIALVVAIVSYYTVMFITPGPNNAMLTISGLKFGFKRSLPHITGISLGHALQVSLICTGLGLILINKPEFQMILKWLCFFYLIFYIFTACRNNNFYCIYGKSIEKNSHKLS